MIKHPKTDQIQRLSNSLSSVVPNCLIKWSSLDLKTDQCWSPSKRRYAMTNIIIILPSLCCHYRRLNTEPHTINDTQPSYHARTHSHSIVVANVPRVLLFHICSTMLLDSCLNGTILDATFHNNMITIVVVAILTTLRPCQMCRHNRITTLHHYKHRHILSMYLLCSLGIATTQLIRRHSG